MQTNSIKQNPIEAYLEETKVKNAARKEAREKFSNEFYLFQEFNRFGVIIGVLLIVGCMGGIAVSLGALASVWQLTAIVIPTMATLAMILAVVPMRYMIFGATIALLVDIMLIVFNLV